MKISNEERAERRATLESARASQRIEGADVSPEVFADMLAWTEGRMALDEVAARILMRIQSSVTTGL